MMVFMEGKDTGFEDNWSFSSSAWNIIGLLVSRFESFITPVRGVWE